jgi:hypothetical protein
MDFVRRLAGKAGMLFAVNGSDRADAVRQARDFLAALKDLQDQQAAQAAGPEA